MSFRDIVIDVVSQGLTMVGDATKEYILEETQNAYYDGIEIGMRNTVAALYEANVKDEEIIRVLNKTWSINFEDATDILVAEKCDAVIRELEHYMILKGFSKKQIDAFMRANKVRMRVRHEHKLWTMKDKPDKLIKLLEEPKSIEKKVEKK